MTVPGKVTPEPYQPKPTTEPKVIPEPEVPPKVAPPEPKVAKIKPEPEAPKVEAAKKIPEAPKARGKVVKALLYYCSTGKRLYWTVHPSCCSVSCCCDLCVKLFMCLCKS